MSRQHNVNFVLLALVGSFIVALPPLLDRAASTGSLHIGATVVVSGIGDARLNARHAPGMTDSPVLFRARQGDRLTIIDGPRHADGYVWWRLRDEAFDVAGWAAGRYLALSGEEIQS